MIAVTRFSIPTVPVSKHILLNPASFSQIRSGGELLQEAFCLLSREFRTWVALCKTQGRPTCHQTCRLKLISAGLPFKCLFPLLYKGCFQWYVLQRLSQSRKLREAHKMGILLFPPFQTQRGRSDLWPGEILTWNVVSVSFWNWEGVQQVFLLWWVGYLGKGD